jgi:predicted RNA binding protein YcfA (HicA-like mRNA interferase family)
MKLPRDLGGSELIKLLCKHYGYRRVDQEGSHVFPQTEQPRHHRIAIPEHNALRLGTLNSILNPSQEFTASRRPKFWRSFDPLGTH